jgi:hypothetical protein
MKFVSAHFSVCPFSFAAGTNLKYIFYRAATDTLLPESLGILRFSVHILRTKFSTGKNGASHQMALDFCVIPWKKKSFASLYLGTQIL